MALLEVDALSVRFGGVVAITEVSLTVGAGEIHGIIGPNGAGKTSLINAVTGMVIPQSGSISLRRAGDFGRCAAHHFVFRAWSDIPARGIVRRPERLRQHIDGLLPASTLWLAGRGSQVRKCGGIRTTDVRTGSNAARCV